MEFTDPRCLIIIMIFFYLLAAALSIFWGRQQRLSNILSNGLCIAASFFGILGSSFFLFQKSSTISIFNVKSAIANFTLSASMDSLSAFFVLGLSTLVLCVSIFSFSYLSHYFEKRNLGLFNFVLITFIMSMFIVFTADNGVSFFIAWEAMSLLSYFLVVFEVKDKEAQRAGMYYIIMMHVATALLMIAFMMMFYFTGTFSLSGDGNLIPGFAKNIMFICFFIGFGTKAGLIPFHIWLPYAHPAAPSNVSALMSGIMIKTAIYGMIRFMFCYLGIQHSWWGVVLLCVGGISCVLGVAYALMESNIKRLLAYSSIENIGIIVMGLGLSFIAYTQGNTLLCNLSMAAALLHTFNHALFKGGLFLGAGAIQYSTGSKDLEKLGGLIKKIPLTAFLFLCFSLAISAVVPFNAFVSEWLTFQSLFIGIQSGGAGFNILFILSVGALALAGSLAAACFIKLFGISFLGRPRTAFAEEAEKIPLTMNLSMGILALLCFLMGVFPFLALKPVDAVVGALTGSSLLGNLKGGFMVAYVPLSIEGNSIDPLIVVIATLLMAVMIFIVVRILGGAKSEQKYNTWDCGFSGLNPRMQYSSVGFSKPLRIVFRMLYRPKRERKIEAGASDYFPESISYTVSTVHIFEKYIYQPMGRWLQKISRVTKFTVQTGSIHLYLSYIFIALLVLMLYNHFF